MNKYLPRLRYVLEFISVPVFAWLVIHLAGHGLMLLKDPNHSHDHGAKEIHATHEEDHHDEDHFEEEHAEDETHDDEEAEAAGHTDHDEHNHGSPFSLEYLLSTEVLGGILALVFFTWLWHQRPLKKFVPCSHDHCHHKTIWPHVLASVAFVFHWFPESKLRHDLLQEFNLHYAADLITALGFLTHFFVDLIVLILLVSFWSKTWQKILSAVVLVAFWILSVWVGEKGGLNLTGLSEPVILILSAFLLAMFVHKPHKPAPECKNCDH